MRYDIVGVLSGYLVVNLCTVVCVYFCPGCKMTGGK